MSITAEFYGGPRDGDILQLPDLRAQWLFPVPVPLSLIYTLDVDPTTVSHQVMVYGVLLDPEMRRPSINDEGRYRYGFYGIR